MQQTANYGLSKPEKTDSVSIDILNENMDKVDAAMKKLSEDTAENIHANDHAAGGSDPITPDMIGAADNALSNLPDPAAALAQIGAAGGPNLLCNWYLADPINQRGQTEYSIAGHTIDRWYLNRAFMQVEADGILLKWDGVNGGNGYMQQRLPLAEYQHLFGATVTMSVIVGGELYSATGVLDLELSATEVCGIAFPNGRASMTIWNTSGVAFAFNVFSNATSGVKISAAKLELGKVQTLAHRDEGGNWVLNDPPPNRAAELLKCCMSTADSSDLYANNSVTPAAIHAAAMEVVSYVGTGLHGSDNPCQATFSFAPKLVLGLFAVGSSGTTSFFPSATNYNNYSVSVDWAMLPGSMTTKWQSGAGLGRSASWGSYWLKQYGKKSADGKTLYWYQDDDGMGDSEGASFQLNTAGTTYYLIAFA